MDQASSRILKLDARARDPQVWNNHQLLNTIAKEKSVIEKSLSQWNHLHTRLKDSAEWIELLEEEPEKAAFSDLQKDFQKTIRELKELELKSFLSGTYDQNDCYVSIHAGAGGTEAADWASILQRMYFRWAEKSSFSPHLISLSPGEEAGIRSCHFLVKGLYACGYLRSEVGVHRLVRISPFDASSRRHTSFASVFAWPEVDDNIDIDIREEDIRTDTYRASGAGGQHINKTDSAVRITHLPTGLVVQCQNQRSQHANRNQAMKMLTSALINKEEEKRRSEKLKAQSSQKANEWGSQIRSYILHPYQKVKDHRTGWESANPSLVLGGELAPFISAYLKNQPLPNP